MDRQTFLDYYERELSYLREDGVEFARKYPKIATRLELSSTGSTDPHVERLIESFAFLTARVQKKIDDDFPEITEALLGILEPQLRAPVPSLSVAQLSLDPKQGKCLEGLKIPRGTELLSPPSRGIVCRFQSAYDVTLWPVRLEQAELTAPRPEESPPPGARSALRLTLTCEGGTGLSELSLDTLRIFLHGSNNLAHSLYEFVHKDISHVALQGEGARPGPPLRARDSIRAVGYEADESLIDWGAASRPGSRLLLEYFVFPQKFLFFDVVGLQTALSQIRGNTALLTLFSAQPPPPFRREVSASAFRLGCTPIVNLFKKSAEPILIHQRQSGYQIVPDRFKQEHLEVCAVHRVRGLKSNPQRTLEYRPIYSISHAQDLLRGEEVPFWYASRRPSLRRTGPELDMHLHLVDPSFQPRFSEDEKLLVEVYCSNHDLPSKLPFGEGRGDLIIEGVSLESVRCLSKPTPSRQLPMGRGLQWRLVSLMALNSLSVSDPRYGAEALREFLTVYDFQNDAISRRQIAGIVGVGGRPIIARIPGGKGIEGVARGVEIPLTLDPDHFVGSSMFLFASVIERFLASNVPVNTFAKLVLRARGQEGDVWRWPPRIGARRLL